MNGMMVWGFSRRSDVHLSVPARLWAVAEHGAAGDSRVGLKTGSTRQNSVRRFTPPSQSPFRRFHTFSCKAGGGVLNAWKRLWSPRRFHCRKCSSRPAVVGCCNFEKQVTYLAFKSLLLPGWSGKWGGEVSPSLTSNALNLPTWTENFPSVKCWLYLRSSALIVLMAPA